MAFFDIQTDHLSGRFDRAPKRLRNQVKASLAAGSTIIKSTEVDRRPRAKALRSIKGTRTLRAPGTKGETAILFDRSVFKARKWGHQMISPPFGKRRGVMLTWAVLEHRETGALGLETVAHYHSNVESGFRAKAGWALEHRRAVAEARRLHKRLRRIWRKSGEPFSWENHSADFNLNLRRAWVRSWVRSAWPGLKPVPKKHTPKQGSHGNRLIDWFLTRGIKKRRMTVLKKHPASDHRGVRLRGRVKVKRRKK